MCPTQHVYCNLTDELENENVRFIFFVLFSFPLKSYRTFENTLAILCRTYCRFSPVNRCFVRRNQ